MAGIFSSKARVDVLKLLFFNPENRYYQRQISALSGQPIRAVQREVIKLESEGLLEKTQEGNRLYYRANKKSPIFTEIKSILFKTTGIAEALKAGLDRKKITAAFIFGSYARGEENVASDIDLMVIGKISSSELEDRLSRVEEETGREINDIVFSGEEAAAKAAKGDHFLSSVMKDKKIFIIGDENDVKKITGSGKTKGA